MRSSTPPQWLTPQRVVEHPTVTDILHETHGKMRQKPDSQVRVQLSTVIHKVTKGILGKLLIPMGKVIAKWILAVIST